MLKGKPYLDGAICPCCGTEFGYNDLSLSHEELRQHWVAKGAQWWSNFSAPPVGWNALAQLYQAGLLSFARREETTAAEGRRQLEEAA